MRNLTSIQSATSVLLDLEFHLQAADVSTTWIFGSNDIEVYPSVSWEIDYTGGLGKPSNYNITIATSMGFINAHYNQLNKGKAFLKVFVNSDNFTPHVGRVRGMVRNASNLNLVDFVVYDDFLDGNPQIPTDALTDSYSTLHPVVSNVDMGYSLYYGKHTRPFYMTPVDCDIGTMLGPRNVSSENHVSSQYWQYEESKYFMINSGWEQQSDSTNLCVRSIPFYVRDNDVGSYYVLLDHTGRATIDTSQVNTPVGGGGGATIVYSEAYGQNIQGNYFYGVQWGYGRIPPYPASLVNYFNGVKLNVKKIGNNLPIGRVVDVKYSIVTSSTKTQTYKIYIKNGGYATTVKDLSTNSLHSYDWESIPEAAQAFMDYADPSWGMSRQNSSAAFSLDLTSYISEGQITFAGQMRSDAYKNHSIFNTQISCSDIAVSENPNGIVADITNQTSFNFIASQNSAAQADTTSYNFQCYLDIRQPFSTLLQDFGNITGTYYWIGDSGYINTKTYQESGTVTNSINYTITPNDLIANQLMVKDNPVGSIFYQTEKASRIKIEYDYDFTINKYNSNLTLDKSNNAFCNSAHAAGIQKELIYSTKYIKETDTASFYANNVVRRSTLDDTLIEGVFPPRFMGLEIADTLHVKNPSLLNSESLFQVTKVEPDYRTGFVKFTANEILNIN